MTESPETMSKNMHKLWSKEAETFRKWYPQHSYRSRSMTQAVIRAARVKTGMCVLDIACGSGEPSLTLAIAVGPSGNVIATDLTEEMLAVARENAMKSGLINIEFRQADALALPFPNESFDAITCRNGVMYFPDVAKAMTEVYRVLKPECYAGFLAWGPAEKNPHWISTLGVVKKHMDLPPMKRETGNPFVFDEPKKLGEEFEKAGFSNISSELVALNYPFPGSPELAWDSFFDTCALMGMLKDATDRQLKDIRADSIETLKEYWNGKELIMDAVVVLASGMKKNNARPIHV